jgi:hypothetical protein
LIFSGIPPDRAMRLRGGPQALAARYDMVIRNAAGRHRRTATQGRVMRKIVTIAAIAVSFGTIAVAGPTAAQAQYYGGYLNQPRSYAPPAYVPPPPVYAAPPVYTRPRVIVTPSYNGGGYYDYRQYGDPTTRDSLATCAYC